MKNAHLLRCAASLVTAAYGKVRLIPQDLRALHLSIFEQPPIQGVFQHPVSEKVLRKLVDAEEFNEVASELVRTLDCFHVPSRERAKSWAPSPHIKARLRRDSAPREALNNEISILLLPGLSIRRRRIFLKRDVGDALCAAHRIRMAGDSEKKYASGQITGYRSACTRGESVKRREYGPA